MFNPFKKKDNEFKLDEISLPNFSDDSNSLPQMPDNLPNQDLNSMPELPSLEGNNNSQPDFSANNSFNQSSEDYSQNSMNNQFSQTSFDGSSNTNPMLNPQSLNESNENKQDSQVHQEIAKAQLETMMSKINLLDARQQNMEQKIEMIYQLILSEVSEDTKRKLNVQSMMGKIKN